MRLKPNLAVLQAALSGAMSGRISEEVERLRHQRERELAQPVLRAPYAKYSLDVSTWPYGSEKPIHTRSIAERKERRRKRKQRRRR